MKTITEFTGRELKETFHVRQELLDAKRQTPAAALPREPEAPLAPQNPQPSAETATVEPSNEPADVTHPEGVPESSTIQLSSEPANVSEQTSAAPLQDPSTDRLQNAVIKSPEELLEERQEEKRKAWEARINEIKPEFTQRLKDLFKWSDERIEHVSASMDAVFRKRLEDLRSVRVLKIEKEGEPFPKNAKKIGEFVYIAEYYPPKEKERPRFSKNRDKNKKRRPRGKKEGFKERRFKTPKESGQPRSAPKKT